MGDGEMSDERVDERLRAMELRLAAVEREHDDLEQTADRVAALLEGRMAELERDNAQLRSVLRAVRALAVDPAAWAAADKAS